MKVIILIIGVCCIVASIVIGKLVPDVKVPEHRDLLAVGSSKTLKYRSSLESLRGYYVVKSFSADVADDSPLKDAIRVKAVEKTQWPEEIVVRTAKVKGVSVGDGHNNIEVEIDVRVEEAENLIGSHAEITGEGVVRFPVETTVEGSSEITFEEKEGSFTFTMPISIVATDAEADVEELGKLPLW